MHNEGYTKGVKKRMQSRRACDNFSLTSFLQDCIIDAYKVHVISDVCLNGSTGMSLTGLPPPLYIPSLNSK